MKGIGAAGLLAGVALTLTACGGSGASGPQVPDIDRASPAIVAAAIIAHTANDEFEQACEHSPTHAEECIDHLQQAYARWSADEDDPSLLEQAEDVSANHFRDPPEPQGGGKLHWVGTAQFADGGEWAPRFTQEESGRYLVETVGLRTTH